LAPVLSHFQIKRKKYLLYQDWLTDDRWLNFCSYISGSFTQSLRFYMSVQEIHFTPAYSGEKGIGFSWCLYDPSPSAFYS